MTLREEADKIIKEAITKVLPDEAVKQALKNRKPVKGKLYLVAVGKINYKWYSFFMQITGNLPYL